MKSEIKLKRIRSYIGSTKKIRETLIGLGLNRMHKVVTKKNTIELQGMIRKVQHLIVVEE